MENLNLSRLLNRKIIHINHHMAHAASAYYTSGLYESAILVLDGLGEHVTTSQVETVTKAFGLKSTINVIDKKLGRLENTITRARSNQIMVNTNSLGTLYEIVTRMCGFSLYQEGKTMGLAAYGTSTYEQYMMDCIKYESNELRIDLRNIMDFISCTLSETKSDMLFQVKADIAYAVQRVLEYYVIAFANELYEQTHSSNLCMAGGLALNSSCNGRLIRETKFKKIHIFPAAGDAGTAVGAALFGYYSIGGNEFYGDYKLRHVYFGKQYGHKEIEDTVKKYEQKIDWVECQKCEYVKSAVKELKAGSIIAWFDGGAEFGPRALGHRSILANPTIKEMKDIINSKVKFREAFRPFAPSVLKEYVDEFFEFPNAQSDFMLFVCRVRDDKKLVIPAVTHVDQSARIQTVTYEEQGIYYYLINEFYKQTGVPMLLNTSFNLKNQPIVETPEEAIVAFINSNIDVLYLNGVIVRKKEEKNKNSER